MNLQIQLICPECNESQWFDFQDFSPGRRQTCRYCETLLRMTADSLALFAKDVRHYCGA